MSIEEMIEENFGGDWERYCKEWEEAFPADLSEINYYGDKE